METLHKLQNVRASSALRKRISGLTATLPERHKGVYMPLVLFRVALVVAALALLVGCGSGVVVAAKLSKPGSPLFPAKKVIEQIQTIVSHQIGKDSKDTPASSDDKKTSPQDDSHPFSGKDTHSGSDDSNNAVVTPQPTSGSKETGEERHGGFSVTLTPTVSPVPTQTSGQTSGGSGSINGTSGGSGSTPGGSGSNGSGNGGTTPSPTKIPTPTSKIEDGSH